MLEMSFEQVDQVSGGHGHHGFDTVNIGNHNTNSFNTGGVDFGAGSSVTLGNNSQVGSNGGLNITNSTF